VAGFMAVIALWHRHNQRVHPHELERLLEIARRDDLHG
jgi:MFS transporter, LPLT family, lysophospholipid transporter